MRVKTLIMLMIVIAMPLTFYLFYVKDVTFDTIKNNYLVPNDQIKKMADSIRYDCRNWQTDECYVLYVKTDIENIKQIDDTFLQGIFDWDNDINHTINIGNDCEGIAVVSASLLHELGLKNIYVITERSSIGIGHDSIGVRVVNGDMKILNSLHNYEIIKIRKLE